MNRLLRKEIIIKPAKRGGQLVCAVCPVYIEMLLND